MSHALHRAARCCAKMAPTVLGIVFALHGVGCSAAHSDGGDAGASHVNETCVTATDITAGGAFTATTCGATDDARFTCGGDGTPDVFFAVHATPGQTFTLAVDPPGQFVVQHQVLSCSATPTGFCGVPMGLSGSFDAGGLNVFGVERATAGACGAFTLTFTIH